MFLLTNCLCSYEQIAYVLNNKLLMFLLTNWICSDQQIAYVVVNKLHIFLLTNCICSYQQIAYVLINKLHMFLLTNCICSYQQISYVLINKLLIFLFSCSIFQGIEVLSSNNLKDYLCKLSDWAYQWKIWFNPDASFSKQRFIRNPSTIRFCLINALKLLYILTLSTR